MLGCKSIKTRKVPFQRKTSHIRIHSSAPDWRSAFPWVQRDRYGMSFSTAAGLPGTHSPQWSPHTTPVGQTHTHSRSTGNSRWTEIRHKTNWWGGAFFMWEKIMWHWLVRSNAVSCSSHADAVFDFFAAYTTALTQGAFQWAGQPPKIALSPWEIWTPSNTWILSHTIPPSNWHLGQFRRFSRNHECNQQTDNDIDHNLHHNWTRRAFSKLIPPPPTLTIQNLITSSPVAKVWLM